MKSLLGCCGLDCKVCPVYIATVQKNEVEKARLAKAYSVPGCEFERVDMNCRGCGSTSAGESKLCGDCPFRGCAKKRGIKSCGLCPDYPCGQVENRLPEDNRQVLDRVRAARTAGGKKL